MSQQDWLFLVLIAIGVSGLTVAVVRLLRRGGRGDRGAWYEGPWDDDEPRKR